MREELADLCHKQWSEWMDYLFSKCDSIMPMILSALEDESLIIPAEFVKRWKRQVNTPYEDLPLLEKESDRKEADKFLKIINSKNVDKTLILPQESDKNTDKVG